MKQILLVDDNKEIHRLVQAAISGLADLCYSENWKKGLEQIQHGQFDLVLLDVELPDGNGVDLCTEVRKTSPDTQIFFLTSHSELSEKVLGFAAGADDYITKPFLPLELKARIESRFRRIDQIEEAADHLRFKEIEIRKSRQEIKILSGSKRQKVDLTALEFKLLVLLAERPFEVISRDEILDTLWGKDVHVYARSVDTHVSKLRKKLSGQSQLVQSVHGSGYKFVPTAP
ncbi:MAG: response regulator transcription factor [Bdellovibrionales bacterium]